MKKTIRDTYIYDVLGLEKAVANCAKVNAHLEKHALPAALVDAISSEIRYKISVPGRNLILEDLRNGNLTLVDTPEVSSIPTWMLAEDGKIKTAVVNLFGRLRRNPGGDTATFNVREVFALCLIAETVRRFYEKENKVVFNMQLTKLSAIIYTRMVYRVLDTLYSLDIAPEWVRNRVRANIGFFFLYHLMEKRLNSKDDYDASYDAILTLIPNGKNLASLPIDDLGQENYSDLKTFIGALARIHPSLKDLDVTIFLRKFIMMYGEKALLMLESYPYFLAYVFSVSIGGNILKDFALDKTVDKEGIQAYNIFFDLVQ